jgi:hypothetical protein
MAGSPTPSPVVQSSSVSHFSLRPRVTSPVDTNFSSAASGRSAHRTDELPPLSFTKERKKQPNTSEPTPNRLAGRVGFDMNALGNTTLSDLINPQGTVGGDINLTAPPAKPQKREGSQLTPSAPPPKRLALGEVTLSGAGKGEGFKPKCTAFQNNPSYKTPEGKEN